MRARLLFSTVSALALVTLAGCGNTEDSGLKAWMDDQRHQVPPKIAPLQPPAPYVPQTYAYVDAPLLDPFNVERLMIGWRPTPRGGTSAFDADCVQRRKEPLENYPLDAMTMVGSLERAGTRVALIRIDKLLYQVRMGNYLGQNCGKVIKISENEVTLREIVRDGADDEIERPVTLQLQEKTK